MATSALQLPQLKSFRGILRNRKAMLAIGIAVVVVLVWLLAYFLPQGKQLSKYQAERQHLQAQEVALQARLRLLRETSKATPQLLQLQAKYGNLVPSSPDMYVYISQMAATAAQAGVHLVSMTPSSTGTPITGTSLDSYPVVVVVSGNYGATLTFMQALYNMPRLTVINGLSISGGALGGGAQLNSTFNLSVYSTAQPPPAG